LPTILTIYMKFFKKYLGIGLIFAGILLLVLLYLMHLTFLNTLLYIPLTFIILGLFVHIWQLKRQSQY